MKKFLHNSFLFELISSALEDEAQTAEEGWKDSELFPTQLRPPEALPSSSRWNLLPGLPLGNIKVPFQF